MHRPPPCNPRQWPFVRAYLIRHADVRNPDGVLYGHLDNFPISTRGRQQAAEVGRRLAGAGITRVYHSPLQRARETAELIAANLGGDVPLIEDHRLREAEFGRYLQGVRPWQVPFRRPLWFVHRARRGLLPGDETLSEMAARVLEVIHEHAERHPGQVAAFVSHADPVQAAWIELDGRPRTEVEMHRKQCARAGRLEIDFDDRDRRRVTGLAYVPPPEVAAGVPAAEPEVPRPA